jgi:putative membrane protein
MGFVLQPIIGVAVNGFTLYLLTRLVDGIVYSGGLRFFVIGGVIVGLINFLVRPILKALSMPFIFFTGGLFLIVINVFVLWFTSYFISVLAFQDVSLVFPDFKTYVIGAIVFGIINWITHLIVK